MMAAGHLRQRIIIRRAEQVQNVKGGYDSAWLTLGTPKAHVEGLDGRETLLAQALQGVATFRITIRWRGDILASDQIVLPDGRELNVRSATAPYGRQRWLTILADSESVVSET
jgi:SPP1 family predicted phage head-tail adaptor